MTITKKQGLAMGLIIATGLLSGAGLLFGDRLLPARPGGHAEEAGHEHDAHGHGGHDHGSEGKSGQDQDAEAAALASVMETGAPDAHGHAHGAEEDRHVKLSEAQVRKAGITTQAAGPGQLQSAVDFAGEIRFNDDSTAHVVPRLAGVAEQVSVSLGQAVRKGQVLAVIASTTLSDQRSELLTAQKRRDAAQVTFEREKKLWQERISAEQDYLAAQTALHEAEIALQNAQQKLAAVGASGVATAGAGLNRFEIRAPFDATVVDKHLSLGEAVKEDTSIFTLSDLKSVWAEFNVAPKDLATVGVGQRVSVSSTAFEGRVTGSISYVGALLGEQTRTARAPVTLTNPEGAWRPGLFVTVSVYGEAREVPLTVPAEALQTIDNQPMVFRATSEGFEAVPVKIGRADGRRVEVLGGLAPGAKVAVKNAFVLKSELGKAEAGHEH
ncbi:MAG: hypothetical protein RL722_1497 [Pseudomonadota bacterium]|jgi:cobalt-zinc-cadmium efflux system membrane fusion protein